MVKGLTLLLFSFFLSQASLAKMPSHPETDPNFTTLPNGQKLSSVKVRGSGLTLSTGVGAAWGASQQKEFEVLKRASQSDPDHPVQWAFMDLDTHRVLSQSLSADRKVFGASVAKVYVAGALSFHQNGQVNSSQLQRYADMLVVSSNTAWTSLQTEIGGGVSDKGRERIHDFTQKMGYRKTRGFQGYWGSLHGNELTASELVEYLYDTYQGQYAGAEYLWKIMSTCRTGSARGRKYLPASMYVGGKTGTYDGPTENPETGSKKNPDGSDYKVRVRNHIVFFRYEGRQYGLAVLANTGRDEDSALLAGGLLRELGYK